MKNKAILMIGGFIIGFIVSIIFAFFKISHLSGVRILFITGIISSLTFIVLAIIEISRSVWIRKSEKVLWAIFIVLLSNLAGLIYFLSARRRILTGEE